MLHIKSHIKKKIVTIKDIAEKAKVSIGTVDRVLHNRGRVEKSTAQKVRKIVKELGYKTNIFASQLSRAKVYNFGVVIPNEEQDSKYWAASLQGIRKAARELSYYHINVTYILYDRYAPERFPTIAKKVASEKLDGLVLAPTLKKPMLEMVEKQLIDIPYVCINTEWPELKPITFIGQDSFQSGVVCGQLMKMYIHTPGTVAVIITVPNDSHNLQRAEGFESAFRGSTQVKINEYEIFQFDDPQKTALALTNMLKANPNLLGIFVTNVAIHYIADFLSKQKKTKSLFLIGYDLIDENRDYLNAGVINFLISQKPEQQGYAAIYTLYRHVILKEKVPPKILMPIDIITKENLMYYHSS
jgi:LacI family transcriptional regulator